MGFSPGHPSRGMERLLLRDDQWARLVFLQNIPFDSMYKKMEDMGNMEGMAGMESMEGMGHDS